MMSEDVEVWARRIPPSEGGTVSYVRTQAGAFTQEDVNDRVQALTEPPVPMVILPALSVPTTEGEVPHELTVGAESPLAVRLVAWPSMYAMGTFEMFEIAQNCA